MLTGRGSENHKCKLSSLKGMSKSGRGKLKRMNLAVKHSSLLYFKYCQHCFCLHVTRFNRQTDAALENHIKKMWTKRLSQEPWIFNGAKFRLHSFMLNSPKKSNCTELLNAPNVNYYKDQESQLNSRQMAEDFPVTDSSHQQNSFDQVDAATSAALASSTCECSGENATTGLTSASAKTTVQEESGYVLTLRLGLTSYKDYLGTNWSRQAEELHRRGEVEFGDPLSLFAQPLGVGAVLCTVDEQVVLIRRSQRVAEAGGLLDIPGGHPEPKVRW